MALQPDEEGQLSPVAARCQLADRNHYDGASENILDVVPTDRDRRTLRDILSSTDGVDSFSVSGRVSYEFPVLKADTIVFRPDSVLEWTDMQAPMWLIVADTLHVQGSAAIAHIPARIRKSPSGARGEHGKPSYYMDSSFYGGKVAWAGEYGIKRNKHKKGRRGGHGGDGGNGEPGATLDLPCLVLIVNNLTFDPGASLSVDLNGITGGDGGDGGNGGQGENGAHASGKWFWCGREPQDGGRGGNGGDGGNGDAAGNGGKGADIVYVGRRSEVQRFMQIADLHNEGGSPGKPGARGDSGIGGYGGFAGHRRLRPCFRTTHWSPKGDNGRWGDKGEAGQSGARGLERLIVLSPDQLNGLLSSVGVVSRGSDG